MSVESLVYCVSRRVWRNDEDWSDRLHTTVTSNILIGLAGLVAAKSWAESPIECAIPAMFSSSTATYAENYCWSQDTYFVEPDQHVELLKQQDRYTPERQLSYYQWVPFFLLLQAAFFRAPSYLWKYFSNSSGIRIHEVVEKAKDAANVEEEVREKNIGVLMRHLANALRFQRRMVKKKVVVHKTVTCLNWQYSSGFISSIYLFTKTLYFINVFAQLWLMNYFLRTNKYQWYGFGVVRDIVVGTPWERSGFFPRSAVCDFEVRQVANIQKYSVQCVLVINIFNEKIFVLLWFWYLTLLVCSAVSFIQWLVLLSFPCFSRWFVSQHLELSSLAGFVPTSQRSHREVAKFVENYLHRDGVFVLRMVSSHAGIIFATDLVQALWKAYYGIEEEKAAVLESPMTDPSTEETQVRHRKGNKKSMIAYLEGGNFSTALIPQTPDYEESSSSESEPPKRTSNNVAI